MSRGIPTAEVLREIHVSITGRLVKLLGTGGGGRGAGHRRHDAALLASYRCERLARKRAGRAA